MVKLWRHINTNQCHHNFIIISHNVRAIYQAFGDPGSVFQKLQIIFGTGSSKSL
jgi:hypothetical protein